MHAQQYNQMWQVSLNNKMQFLLDQECEDSRVWRLGTQVWQSGWVQCLSFLNHYPLCHLKADLQKTDNEMTEKMRTHQWNNRGTRLGFLVERKSPWFIQPVSRAPGGLSRSSMPSPLLRAPLFIWEVASFRFSSCPSFDLFWCSAAVNKKI